MKIVMRAAAPCGERRGLCVGRHQVVEVTCGCAVYAGQRLLDDRRDVEEPMRPARNAPTATSFAALKAHGAVASAFTARAGEREQREGIEIGCLEREVETTRSSCGTGVAARSG